MDEVKPLGTETVIYYAFNKCHVLLLLLLSLLLLLLHVSERCN